jgi:hypothetical protein
MMLCVNARSLLALGATIATLIAGASAGTSGAAVVAAATVVAADAAVVAEGAAVVAPAVPPPVSASEPHAPPARASTATRAVSSIRFLTVLILIVTLLRGY